MQKLPGAKLEPAEFIRRELESSLELKTKMAADERLQAAALQLAAESVEAIKKGGKILLCGNGGSAADAMHLAGELVCRLSFDRPGIAAIALTPDAAVMTAIANDYSYDRVFARQVEALGREGDMLWAFSTSGRSKNVLAALGAAREKGVRRIGFTGKFGGEMQYHCDATINIPSEETPRIQEGYMLLGHAICALIEQSLFRK